MCLTPSLNVAMTTASDASFGFRRAIPCTLGISVGFGALAAFSMAIGRCLRSGRSDSIFNVSMASSLGLPPIPVFR